MHIDGACQCKKITYEAEIDPEDVAICHCTDCQRLTGTAYKVTVSTQRSQFQITSGEPRLYVKTADNGRRRLQFFCSDCGSPIYTTGENEDAEEVGIRLGTVNQRQELRPRSQIWCSSALGWAQDLTGLPGRAGDWPSLSKMKQARLKRNVMRLLRRRVPSGIQQRARLRITRNR